MEKQEFTYLKDDLLNGLAENYYLFKPVFIAQQIFKDAKKNEKDILYISEELFNALDKWKIKYGTKPVQKGLLSVDKTIEESEPWECAGWGVNDYVDLIDHLKSESYQPLKELINKHSEVQLLGVIILILSAQKRENDIIPANIYFDKEGITALKAITNIHLLQPSTSNIVRSFNKYLAKLYTDMELEAEKQYKTKLGQLGGLSRAKYFNQLKNESIILFNKGKYPSMKNGSENICEKVAEIDRQNKGLLKSSSIFDTVYRWIRAANKKELLYKKF